MEPFNPQKLTQALRRESSDRLQEIGFDGCARTPST